MIMENTPGIVAYCCEWGGYSSADQAGRLGIPLPTGILVVEVRCVGQVDAGALIEPFLHRAHGVLLAGCRVERCHYLTGNIMARGRVDLAQRLLALCGVDPRRVRLAWLEAADGEGFARETDDFTRTLAPLGHPVPGADTALSLRAALMASEAEKLRWLAGVGYDLKKTGNVFGRVLSEEEFSRALDEVVRDAFLQARLLLLLKQSPRTSRELADAADEDVGRVSGVITLLEKEGKVRHHSSVDGLPRFAAEGT